MTLQTTFFYSTFLTFLLQKKRVFCSCDQSFLTSMSDALTSNAPVYDVRFCWGAWRPPGPVTSQRPTDQHHGHHQQPMMTMIKTSIEVMMTTEGCDEVVELNEAPVVLPGIQSCRPSFDLYTPTSLLPSTWHSLPPTDHSHHTFAFYIHLFGFVEQRIEYKLISLTYKILTTSQPTYLNSLISLQTDNNTRSSDVVTIARPSPASSLKIADRSFQYASPHLWNQLPSSLREPVSPLYAYLKPSFSSPLSPSITPSLFHSKLKTYLCGKSFPP